MAASVMQASFNYAALDQTTRTEVEAATRRLHDLERRTSEAILEIGNGLLFVKAKLGHGQFLPWLEHEFGWSEDTAERFMSVASTFGHIPQIAEYAGPSALYALAAKSTPADIRIEFTELAAAGERVTHKDVKARLDEVKAKTAWEAPKPPRHVAMVDLDSGEIIEDEPEVIEGEYVDPAEPASFLPRPAPPIQSAPPAGDEARLRSAAQKLIDTYGRQQARAIAQLVLDLTS